jgi:hypothetical protein
MRSLRDGGPDGLRGRARTLIREGKLPSTPAARLWAGPARGAICALCGEPITPPDFEIEVEFDGSGPSVVLRFHRECHEIWNAERAAAT